MVVASVVCAVAATWLGQRLQSRYGTWNATLLACAAFVVVIGALMAVLPALGELSTMPRPTTGQRTHRDPAAAA